MHNVSAPTIWKQDQKKKKTLKQLGYEVEVIHECDIRRELAESEEMREFFETCSIPVQKRKNLSVFSQEPLDVSDAFFGGRTESFVLYSKVGEDETGRYVDFCSLQVQV